MAYKNVSDLAFLVKQQADSRKILNKIKESVCLFTKAAFRM